jgi:hypothetical protein
MGVPGPHSWKSGIEHFDWDRRDDETSLTELWKKSSTPWTEIETVGGANEVVDVDQFLEIPQSRAREHRKKDFKVIATDESLAYRRCHPRDLADRRIAWLYDCNQNGQPRTYNGVQSQRSLYENLFSKVGDGMWCNV